MWNSWWQDIRYAARLAVNNPLHSAVIVGCLALGIGPTTTTFSLINAALLHSMDIESPDRLVTIAMKRGDDPQLNDSISYPDFVDLRDRSTTLSEVVVVTGAHVSVRAGDTSELLDGAMVSPNYFDALGRKAALGEVFHAMPDESPGGQPLMVLGHGYWQDHFHSDPQIVGKTMRLNGHDFSIVGVMPASFTGETPVAQPPFWVSTAMLDQVRPEFPSQRLQRRHSWMRSFGRLREGVTLEKAQAELSEISRQMATEMPDSYEFISFAAVPFTGLPLRAVGPLLQLVALAGVVVILLLLLSCTSTAALQLSRATVRKREIAIRMAVGASRLRIFRQLLIESVFLALVAGGVALLLALWAFELYKVLLPAEWLSGIVLGSSLDYRVFAFTLLASLAAGILFGLAPAWQMSRPDLIAPLKSQDPGGDYGSARVRNVLVAAQFALAVVLLISAGLFVSGLMRAQTLDPGFEREHMLVFETQLNLYGLSVQKSIQFVDDFVNRVGDLKGVEHVSVSRFPPLSFHGGSRTGITPIGDDLTSGTSIPVGQNNVAPGYFKTIGIPLLAGRDFTAADTSKTRPVTIINETLARHFGGNQAAIGKLVTGGGKESPEIVGVVADSKYWSLGEKDVDFVYWSLVQQPSRELTFCIRTAGSPEPLADKVAEQIRAINPDVALSTLRTIRGHTYNSLQPARLSAILFLAFGGLALLLAVIGVYGVVAYSVTRRKLEIGVRMALGSQPRDLVALLVRRGLRLVAIGALVGIVAALSVTRFLTPLLSGESPTDWKVFLGVPVLLMAVAWLAIYLPARKATRVDPMVVLRYE
jgi:macrolide transport system ATP-binding/permease protein